MQHMPHWWEKSVAYQIYPRSFYDSNGDGIGDIKGMIEKLPYLETLGVDILWLSPVFQSPMADNGYDISDYRKIASEFGSMEDMETLLYECEKRGMKVLLDLVVNHTSDQHEWFQKALQNPDSKYRQYYYFRKGKNGGPPNNWRSLFGGSAWEPVENSDEYYLHLFYKEQPDLNWENPELRQEIYTMVEFWLKKGLGGFRVDAIVHIKKDFSKNLPPDGLDGLADCVPAARNIPGIGTFLTEMKQKVFLPYCAYTVGEAQGVEDNQFQEYSGEDGYFDEIFDFHAVEIDIPENGTWEREADWTPESFREMLFRRELAAQKGGRKAQFLENHDQVRSLNRFIPASDRNYHSATMLATVFMLLRGIPYIYQGQEIGMTNCEFQTIEECRDTVAYTQYETLRKQGFSKEKAMERISRRCRDTVRSPMQWNEDDNAGFTTGTPWIKLAENYKEVNVKKELETKDSIFHWYQLLIALRRHSPYSDILCKGIFEPYDAGQETVIAYLRNFEERKVLVVCNFSRQQTQMKKPAFSEVLLNNYKEFMETAEGFILLPYQAMVLALEN